MEYIPLVIGCYDILDNSLLPFYTVAILSRFPGTWITTRNVNAPLRSLARATPNPLSDTIKHHRVPSQSCPALLLADKVKVCPGAKLSTASSTSSRLIHTTRGRFQGCRSDTSRFHCNRLSRIRGSPGVVTMMTGVTIGDEICSSTSTRSSTHRFDTHISFHFYSLSFTTAFAHLHSLSPVTLYSIHTSVFTIPIFLTPVIPICTLTRYYYQDEDHRHPICSDRCRPRGSGSASSRRELCEQQAPKPKLPDIHWRTWWRRCHAHHRLRQPRPQVRRQG